ncbi:MAG: LysM peptidoglycan-binding domain-containing protein [Cocleimonas sp.]|nr:LysM peptidoglycan-binding domain-containing protein [Cocleimonas sp.]
MKKSIYTISLVALAMSMFTVSVQADNVTQPNLSVTPISSVVYKKMTPQKTTTMVVYKSKLKPAQRATRLSLKVNKNKAKPLTVYKAYKTIVVNGQSIAYYKVRSGDTLYKIAEYYGTTVKAIMSLNKLKSSKIKAGSELKISTMIYK